MIFVLRVFVGFLLLWLVATVSIFFHELGHMVGYQFSAKQCEWFIRIGTGKQILKTRRFCVHIFPFGGYFSVPDEFSFETKGEYLMTIAGGPIFSLLVIVALFVLERQLFASNFSDELNNCKDLLILLRKWNTYLFLFTTLPIRYPGFLGMGSQSDGLLFLKALRENNAL